MFVNVIIDISNKNVDNVFTYKVTDVDIPCDFKDLVGYRCIVPFGKGNKRREGFILGVTNECDYKNVKSVFNFPDSEPVFSKNQIKLALYIKEMYFCTTFDALKLMKPMGVSIKGSPIKYQRFVTFDYDNRNFDEFMEKTLRRDSKQTDIIYYLKKVEKDSVSHIREYFNITNGPIDSLIKKGILKVINEEVRRPSVIDNKADKTTNKALTTEQKQAFKMIEDEYNKDDKCPILLHGVTGSVIYERNIMKSGICF